MHNTHNVTASFRGAVTCVAISMLDFSTYFANRASLPESPLFCKKLFKYNVALDEEQRECLTYLLTYLLHDAESFLKS